MRYYTYSILVLFLKNLFDKIIIIILEQFGEDAYGRNGHGHVSKS
jgi:hypothetical protein